MALLLRRFFLPSRLSCYDIDFESLLWLISDVNPFSGSDRFVPNFLTNGSLGRVFVWLRISKSASAELGQAISQGCSAFLVWLSDSDDELTVDRRLPSSENIVPWPDTFSS